MRIITYAALAATVGVAALLPPSSARAMCGPIGREQQIVEVDGDQRVFIYHRNGMEDLVLQASIKGNGADFGMVLPLPAVPDIRKVERGFFDDLFDMTRTRQVAWEEGARAAGGAGKMMADNAALERVEVVKKDVVGPFETVVLKARKLDALNDWLGENGYKTSDENKSLMQSYLDKEWFFVAVKVTVEGQKQQFDGRAQPMGFRFPTKTIVLPTKMASIVKDGMAFTIYVVTNSRVSLPGFEQQGVTSLARPLTAQELRSRPNIAAVFDADVLLSPDGGLAKLAEAQRAVDEKQLAEFMGNRYRGLFVTKFNGFFPKDKLAKGDVEFRRENVLDADAVARLLDQLAQPAAQSDVARQLLEAAGSEQLDALSKGLHHTDYRVKRATAEILGVISDPRAASSLVEAMKTESDDFVKSGINRALQAISGRAIKSHQVEQWEEWLKTQK
ncbi:MAG: hypothetical protein FD180_3649 [Planctomycetota bacterium]|nr:MAG: hypothetical protein FD180_3649 [Planctomycetota bacterium]